ncbi:MAG: SemiSWEET family transporter [Anaerolineales bacterium]
MNFISTLGFTGTIIDLLRAAPQLVRLLRERKSFGVSVDTSGTSCVVSLGWTTYGIITNQIFVALASGAIASFFFIITVAALRLGRSAREFRVTPLWFIVLFSAVVFFGKTGLGLMLSVSALISNVPQIRVAYKEENLSGLSLGTWLLTLSGGLVWLVYGILQNDLTIIVSTIFQSVTSAIIIGLKLFKQRTENAASTRLISD